MEQYQPRPLEENEQYVPIDPASLQFAPDAERSMIILEKTKTPFFVEKASYFDGQEPAFETSGQEPLGQMLDTEL